MDYKTTVFISYSWENETHNKRVERFIKKLRENNIYVLYDRDMPLGERITDFMEIINKSEYVLLLCTPIYKEKADNGVGGITYEKHIITAQLYEKGNEEKNKMKSCSLNEDELLDKTHLPVLMVMNMVSESRFLSVLRDISQGIGFGEEYGACTLPDDLDGFDKANGEELDGVEFGLYSGEEVVVDYQRGRKKFCVFGK